MPALFQSTYTPIAAAGTDGQKRHLARLMATQLTAAGLGPGVEEMSKISEEKAVRIYAYVDRSIFSRSYLLKHLPCSESCCRGCSSRRGKQGTTEY